MMKLTKREKSLILLLIIIIIFWGINNFIFLPQKNKIINLKSEKVKYEEEIKKVNTLLDEYEKSKGNFNNLSNESQRLLNGYFPNIEQAEILYVLNELIDISNLKVVNIDFAETEVEEKSESEELTIEFMDTTLFYEGKYEELLDFISRVKKSSRKFIVANLKIDRNEGKIMGEITLRAYSILDVFPEGENTINIENISKEERKNPFAPYNN